MRKFYVFAGILILCVFNQPLVAQPTNDSVAMGPGYANEVYYSFANGTVAEVPRSGWDIAFHTELWSATILTNEGVGVQLWNYPKADTTAWASVDTTGLATWKVYYNNHATWDDGALNRYATGHPDYGWGVYNMVSHNVIGDSILIIKTESGAFKKLRIVKKVSVANTFYFKYANLDGTEEHSIVLDVNPYTSKNLVAYSIDNNQVVDREPAKDAWDLLFTKYMTIYPTGDPYLVTGVLTNWLNESAKAYPVAPNYTDWSVLEVSNVRDRIGYDWKTFDMGTFSYIIEDSIVYFVKDVAGNMNSIVMTGFGGSASGKFSFEKAVASANGLSASSNKNLVVWPNPAKDVVNVMLTGNESLISVYDLCGNKILEKSVLGLHGTYQIANCNLVAGIYVLRILQGDSVLTSRFVIQ
jgi:hypothetical protein